MTMKIRENLGLIQVKVGDTPLESKEFMKTSPNFALELILTF